LLNDWHVNRSAIENTIPETNTNANSTGSEVFA